MLITMIQKPWWLILALECIFVCISSQSSHQKRKCVFQVKPRNNIFRTFGNVSGSVQVCEHAQCCLSYYVIVNGKPEVEVLACSRVEKSCPEKTCETKTSFSGHFIKCVCNTDLCNGNIISTNKSEVPRLTYSYSGDKMGNTALIVVGMLSFLVIMIVATKLRRLFKEKKENAPSLDGNRDLLCSCETRKSSEIDVENIELQRIVSRGHFATVWQGKYHGFVVAVKDFPSGWKNAFRAEKEIFELPLMKHEGIIHFLGTGMKSDGSSFIVLQFVECGSLHSYLSENTTTWSSSLKLCQSLTEGLAYLHTDLCKHDLHKPPVAHRDLSSSNVLVRADGTCALCDFGSSTILRSFSGHYHSQSRTRNMESHFQFGTLRYMPPEILQGSVNLRNTWCFMQGDIYALALLLWEIWMRCTDLFEGGIAPQHLLPYESELGVSVTQDRLIQYVCHTEGRPSIPQHWNLLPQGSELEEILTDSWDSEPDARLSAHCLLERLNRCDLLIKHLHTSLCGNP